MRRGCFGFASGEAREIHPNYVAEKLGDHPESPTVVALAELISGVLYGLAAERLVKA